MNNLDLDIDDTMANYLRLASLGKVRGRAGKIISDFQNPELNGTAMPLPELPPPQIGNFDVRANAKIEPPVMQQGPAAADDDTLYSKLSRGLSSVGNGLKSGLQSIGSGLLPDMDYEPPMSQAMAQPAPSNLTEKSALPFGAEAMGNLQNPLSLLPMGEILQTAVDPLSVISQLKDLVFGRAEAEELPPNQLMPEMSNQPDPNFPAQTTEPGNVQPGAVAEVMSQPDLKSQVDSILGPIDPAMIQAAESYEKAMNAYANNLDDVTARLTEEDKQIKERIESRNLSLQDKILMALAIIAPVIASGFIGGKEALFGALGGGAEGLSNLLNARDKEGREDQKQLTSVAVDKAKIGKEKANAIGMTQEHKAKIAESIPNNALRSIFMRDGEMIKSPDGKDRLVINSGNPLLPIKADAIRDESDYKKLKEESHKLVKGVATLDKAEKIMDSMYDLAEMSEKARSNKNLLQKGLSAVGNTLNLYDYATGALKAFIPATRDTIKDENGNEIKIAELMSTYRAQLADAWRDAHGNNSNAFKATETHFNNQLPDPNSWKSFLSGQSDINQFVKQLDLVKENFEDSINYMDMLGFDTTRLRQGINNKKRNKTVNKQQSVRQKGEELARDAIQKNQAR